MSNFVDAWHFLAADGRLRHPHRGDRLAVTPGLVLVEDRPLALSQAGLHASVRALDAMEFAPGPVVCRVRLSGRVLVMPGCLCAERREALAVADASDLLHLFACDVAESALLREREQGGEPDPRKAAALAAKRRWVAKEITDEELAAAWDDAYAASWDVDPSFIDDAIAGAAGDNALESAWDAVYWASFSRARGLPWALPGVPHWDADNEAAWYASIYEPRNAIWEDANALLESRLFALLNLTPPIEGGDQ